MGGKDLVTVVEVVVSARLRRRWRDMIYKGPACGIRGSGGHRGRSLRMDDEARDTIERFHEALNRRDLDALGDLITDDCVFEATSPAPDGTRHVGRQAVLEACRVFFAGSPATHFDMEEMFGAGDRVIVRWIYTWADGHVRGVDVLRVRAGRVAETLAYVKG
jgi:ketosteroid isomerase-like protein